MRKCRCLNEILRCAQDDRSSQNVTLQFFWEGASRTIGWSCRHTPFTVYFSKELISLQWNCSNGVAMKFARITHNPTVMGGKPCIRGLRVTVGTIVGLLAAGQSRERILEAYRAYA